MTADNEEACVNTDREIWREREGDYYADAIFVTREGGIGINCGGFVFVKPIREWFKLAGPVPSLTPPSPASGSNAGKRLDRDTLMTLIRKHFNEDMQRELTFKRWKDGIEIDYPVYAIEAFAEGVRADLLALIARLEAENAELRAARSPTLMTEMQSNPACENCARGYPICADIQGERRRFYHLTTNGVPLHHVPIAALSPKSQTNGETT